MLSLLWERKKLPGSGLSSSPRAPWTSQQRWCGLALSAMGDEAGGWLLSSWQLGSLGPLLHRPIWLWMGLGESDEEGWDMSHTFFCTGA